MQTQRVLPNKVIYHVYKIAPGYRQVTILTGDDKTGRLIWTHKSVPTPSLPRHSRYLVIAEKLKEHKIPVPSYIPTKREKV